MPTPSTTETPPAKRIKIEPAVRNLENACSKEEALMTLHMVRAQMIADMDYTPPTPLTESELDKHVNRLFETHSVLKPWAPNQVYDTSMSRIFDRTIHDSPKTMQLIKLINSLAREAKKEMYRIIEICCEVVSALLPKDRIMADLIARCSFQVELYFMAEAAHDKYIRTIGLLSKHHVMYPF
ncbi:uncharacterized protein AB675_376 [Cyphellophora attinorum]|uniref:Uncharacterized protein n=1 Tax=Cyphellophora attinorum TaxID=1664694 RepID=A0A0N0NRV5_9EURO|nr:uncharacterized protein AB675_376 [Phialophora attinorum]KPI45531.1 hypothetical protein AB675_376 [Phialophora attinorum]